MRNFAVNINNAKGLPMIYKGDPQKLTLSISNLHDKAVVPDEVELFLPDNLYFESSINVDSLNENWEFSQREGGAKFIYTGKAKTELLVGDTINIYLNNLQVVSEERLSRKKYNVKVKIGLYIYDVYLSLGTSKPTDLISIELAPQEVHVGGNYENSFDLRIMNTAVYNVRGAFIISFPIGNKKSDLTNNFPYVEYQVTQSPIDLNIIRDESTFSWNLTFKNEDDYLEPDGVIVVSFSKLVPYIGGTSKINVTIDDFAVKENDYEYDYEFATRGIKKTELPTKRLSNFHVELSSDKFFYPKDEITADLSWNMVQVSSIKIRINGVEKQTQNYSMTDTDGATQLKLTIILGKIDRVNNFEIEAFDSNNHSLGKLSEKVKLQPLWHILIDGRLTAVIKINDLIWMAEDYYVEDKQSVGCINGYGHSRTSWFSQGTVHKLIPKNGWRLPTKHEWADLLETYRTINPSVDPDKATNIDTCENLHEGKFYFNSWSHGYISRINFDVNNTELLEEISTFYMHKSDSFGSLILHNPSDKDKYYEFRDSDFNVLLTVRLVKKIEDFTYNSKLDILI